MCLLYLWYPLPLRLQHIEDQSLMFCIPKPPVSFSCRTIQSLVGHAFLTVLDSDMVAARAATFTRVNSSVSCFCNKRLQN